MMKEHRLWPWIGVVGLFMGMGLDRAVHQPVIETEKLIIKNSTSSARIELDASNNLPTFQMIDKEGKTLVQIALSAEGGATINLADQSGAARLQIQGGTAPGFFLKNPQGEIIGAMLTLQDGGGAIGLADHDGDVAALLRGGASPSLGLFHKANEPNVAIGISKDVPHLLLTSRQSKDSLIIHGGETTSLLFVDEQGQIPVFMSKHGVFQGKQQQQQQSGEAPQKGPSEKKIFTWDEDDYSNPIGINDLKIKADK